MDSGLLYVLIGQKIRQTREAKGLSQQKVANRLGLSRASVVNIEAGRQKTPVHVLWEIALILDTEIQIFLPIQRDLIQNEEVSVLDDEAIRVIEEAASDDLQTRRKLESFISKAKSRHQEDK